MVMDPLSDTFIMTILYQCGKFNDTKYRYLHTVSSIRYRYRYRCCIRYFGIQQYRRQYRNTEIPNFIRYSQLWYLERNAHPNIQKTPLQRTMTLEYPMRSFDIVIFDIVNENQLPQKFLLSVLVRMFFSMAGGHPTKRDRRFQCPKASVKKYFSAWQSKLLHKICKLIDISPIFTPLLTPQLISWPMDAWNVSIQQLAISFHHCRSDSTEMGRSPTSRSFFAILSSVNRFTGDTTAQACMGRDPFVPSDTDSRAPFDQSIDSYRDCFNVI